MKLVFMGTPDFAAGILEAIYECGAHEITAVVTQPDRPKGRSGEPVPGPVKVFAKEHGITVLQPVKIREKEEIEKLSGIEADIFVVAAFGQILPKEILDMPRCGCINVHASLLPEYRGAAPIQWAICDGKKVTGVTIQQMNEGVDTGDIISAVEVPIADDETGGSLFDKLMIAGEDLTVKTLSLIEKGEATYTPQDEEKATRAIILKKEMGRIDFTKSAAAAERMIRAFTPWPGGFTYLDGKLLKIKKCAVTEGEGAPGTIIEVGKDHITVAFAEGALAITRMQLDGRKEMPAHDFLLGNKIQTGMRLGEPQEKEGR